MLSSPFLSPCMYMCFRAEKRPYIYFIKSGIRVYTDYFMVGERVRFLFTSCEGNSQNVNKSNEMRPDNSIYLHFANSLHLTHSKYKTFLPAVFEKQLNFLSHFEGFCVLIVELCPSPGKQ